MKKKNKDVIFLGEDAAYDYDQVIKSGLNNNIIITGSSGAGKTMSVIEPRLLHTYESNVVISVSKPSLVLKYQQMLKTRGYDVRILNLLEPNMYADTFFDPLRACNSTEEITDFCGALIDSTLGYSRSVDPFWPQSSKNLAISIAGYVKTKIQGTGFRAFFDTLDSIRFIGGVGQRESDVTSLDADMAVLNSTNKNFGYFYRCWRTFSLSPERTKRCILTTLYAALASAFPDTYIAAAEQNPQINLNNMILKGDKKTALMVINPALRHSATVVSNVLFENYPGA